jgi:hypothetical protein
MPADSGRAGSGRASILAAVVFVAAAGAGVVLAATVASGRPILFRRWSILWELAAWATAWMVAVGAAWRLPRRAAVAAIVVVGIALRLAALAGPPPTSDDLYRYAWDGHVQVAGIDPYAYPPDSPSLRGLHEPWLWPDAAGCATLNRPAGCSRINRPSRRTIYPPVAEAWFAAAFRIGGDAGRHKTWQVAGLVTELAVLGLLPLALRRWGRDPRWLVWYALSPAPVFEIVTNGHVDGLAVVAIVAALAVAAGPRVWWRDVAAGALIGAAALVKLYPGILLLALVGVAGLGGASATRRYTAVIRAGATAAALAALAYLPHVLRVGPRVLGYLPGYLAEEKYNTGGRFLLAALTGVPGRFTGPLSGLVLLAVMAWVVARRPPVPVGASVVLGALLLVTSPVQPWYAVSLLAVATIAGKPGWAAVAAAGYPYYFAVILDDRHARGHGQAAYALALVVVVVAAVVTSRSSRLEGSDVKHPVGVGAPGMALARHQDSGREGDPAVASGVAE